MTRASFLIALVLSAAASAQQPPALPLPGAEPALPLPGVEKKPEVKKAAANKAPPPPLPLPGLDAPKPGERKPSENKAAAGKAAPTLELPGTATPPPSAIAQKPPAAPVTTVKAVPASDKPKSAFADKPGGPVAPLAASSLRLGDMRLRPDLEQQLWTVRGFVGGERSSEQNYTDSASHSRLGAEVTRWFRGTWLARGELDWRSSSQAYVPLHSASNSPVKVDENRFDLLATLGYDLGPRLLDSGRLELTPMLGVAYLGIRNQAFPSDLIGPNLGGRVRYALSPAVTAHATIGYTFNLAVASVQNSALKSPKGDFSTRAGLSLPLSGGYALELDYSGDVIAFENTFRVAHGAALGFGTSF